MKKTDTPFLITALSLLAVWLIAAAFAVGTINAPSEYWLPTQRKIVETGDTMNAYTTLDLDRNLNHVDENGELTKKLRPINSIYVFVGRAYTYDEEGFITVLFDFKTQSSSMDESYNKRITAKIPMLSGDARYNWYKVYDAEESGESGIEFSRVKIATPDRFEFYEVAFADAQGEMVAITGVVAESLYSKEERDYGKYLIDEQKTFTASESRINKLTESECNQLSAVNSFITGNGLYYGDAPLQTLLNSVGVLIFGRNTFGIRFMSFFAGYIAILILYSFIKKLFGNSLSPIVAVIIALSIGALFSASVLTSGEIFATCFMLYAFKLAVEFFGRHYLLLDRRAGISNAVSTGLLFGLAISCYMPSVFMFIGFALIYAFALRREYVEYKNDEKQAKGLGKEDVYQAHRKKAITFGWSIPVSIIVIPAVLFMLFGLIVYSNNFTSGIGTSLKNAFSMEYAINPLGLFVGIGSDALSGRGGIFLNYTASIISTCAFVFTTYVVLFGKKNVAFEKGRAKIVNKYKILISLFIGAYIACLIGMKSSIVGMCMSSILLACFVPLAITAILPTIGKNKTRTITYIALGLSVLPFLMGIVGYLGISVPDMAVAILYGWQM